MNYYNIFKNNWKKITFAAVGLGFGANYAKSQYEVSQHLRLICQDVAAYSDTTGSKPKQVLVIINPVANKKKAESLFKKYCEPILHLAGYSVDIVKTNHVGHAKSYIENLKVMPDAIVVAGGDGTSSEVVTGLMRRNQAASPLVLLPLGCRNKTVLKYAKSEPKNKLEHVKLMTTILHSMVHEKYRFENVIKYDVIEDVNSADGTETDPEKRLKPIYGLGQFSWGLLRDIESVKEKYWYFGNLRHYAAALIKSVSSDLTWNFETDFIYTPPCEGCLNCEQQVARPASKSYLGKLLTPKFNENYLKNLKHNENCTTEIKGHIEPNQLNITCDKNGDAFYELQTQVISSLHPGLDFVKHVPSITHNSVEPELVLKSRTIQLIPTTTSEKDSFYSIDGEEYDVRPIKISLIPNAIKIAS